MHGLKASRGQVCRENALISRDTRICLGTQTTVGLLKGRRQQTLCRHWHSDPTRLSACNSVFLLHTNLPSRDQGAFASLHVVSLCRPVQQACYPRRFTLVGNRCPGMDHWCMNWMALLPSCTCRDMVSGDGLSSLLSFVDQKSHQGWPRRSLELCDIRSLAQLHSPESWRTGRPRNACVGI